MAEDAEVLRRKLSLNNRAGLLHMLSLVALSAGGFADQEMSALVDIAKMLGLSPHVFRGVIEAAGAEAPEGLRAAKRPRKRRRKKAKAAPEATPEEPPQSSTSGA